MSGVPNRRTYREANWALAVVDPAVAEQIPAADGPNDAAQRAAQRAGQLAGQRAGQRAAQAQIRPSWPVIRTGVMTRLLRAKFAQHPELAQMLLATGDGRIEYTSGEHHWGAHRGKGRNWMGRLLELIRSELAAQQAGDPAGQAGPAA
jgi:predicted NAD-dependent protein-ADP-ribosyltransferase YbiA (DUF1768 family)